MYPTHNTPPVAASSAARRFQIRPLSTGEILDRTISLYSGSFWFCTGVAVLPALVSLLSGASRLIYLQVYHLSPLTSALNSGVLAGITLFWLLVSVVAYGLSHAALTWGLGSIYLGRPATLAAAVSVVRRHPLRYPGLTLTQLLVAGWPTVLAYIVLAIGLVGLGPRGLQGGGSIGSLAATGLGALLVFASLPYSIYRYLQISLAMPASVLEDLAIRPALLRSRALLPDRKGRVFVVFLVAMALYSALAVVVGVLALLGLRGSVSFIVTQIIALTLTFAAALLLQPLFAASFVLVYYDERVRREGFDIQFMMSEAQHAVQSPEPHTVAYSAATPSSEGTAVEYTSVPAAGAAGQVSPRG